MTQQQYKDQLIKQIEDAVAKFNSQMPALEKELAGKLTEVLRDVELKNGKIANTAINLRKVSALKSLIEKTVLNSGYLNSVQQYVDAFEKIIDLQNKYFKTIDKNFSPNKFLEEVRKTSIDATISSLTESGLKAAVVDPIRGILRENITTGAKFADMVSKIQEAFVSTQTGNPGLLSAYAKTATIDALNQYSATYSEAVTKDLGLDWFQYTGTLRATSRIFCRALVKKRWFHRSEIPNLLKGNFQEFRALGGKINEKTGLPDGMIEGTDALNFIIRRGGYRCNHQPIPVADNVVPLNLRMKFAA